MLQVSEAINLSKQSSRKFKEQLPCIEISWHGNGGGDDD
jgi:hypothetical protein